jgi:hypothetical protein
MPLRHDGHILDGDNVSPLARRERQSDEPDDGATHVGTLNENALRLLQIMGTHSGWASDVLLERSALDFLEL